MTIILQPLLLVVGFVLLIKGADWLVSGASSIASNFKVSKHTKNNVTTTTLNKLTPKEKLEEIARMLAGEKITEEARGAAQVLLNKDPQPDLF